MKRKAIPKATRIKVWEKYNHHCAYCGCKLKYAEMQVDHIKSVFLSDYQRQEADNSIDNLMPACRPCNFYKNVNDIESFRGLLKDVLQKTAVASFQTRLAIKYGMVEVKEWDGKFYFERVVE